jgi:predicted transcriptional regulator
MSANEWAQFLVDAKSIGAEKVPSGWKTRLELEEEWNFSQAYTGRKIQSLLKLGKIEKKTFKVLTGNKIYPIPHYKIKK